MKTRFLFVYILILFSYFASAEGTRELAPNAVVNIDGDSTTDLTAIYIGNFEYGNFAHFNSSNSERLNVRILDPTSECLMLGFSYGQDISSIDPIPFRFYVRDPNGTIIYESDPIEEFTAPIQGWEQAVAGPQTLVGEDGYSDILLSSDVLMSGGWTGEGDYFIEFERIGWSDQSFIIPFWDITVGDCSLTFPEARPGRVWSSLWALFTPWYGGWGTSHFSRPFNGSFYIVAPDEKDPGAGFVTQMDFNGSRFRGAAFNVALNSFGATNTGNITTNRRSIFNRNTIRGEYPVFLNDPVDLYRTAELGELEILGAAGCLPDDYCFLARSTVTGEIELLLDFDGGDGIYTPDTRDVLINFLVEAAQVDEVQCIEWDGLDGLGVTYVAEDFDSIPVVSSFRQGIYHFPVYDVEINLTGFTLEAVRPAGLAPVMYYDDSGIPFNSNTGSPKTELVGCTSPCHTWSGSTQGSSYGNENTINSWWYARTLIDEKNVAVKFNKFTDIDLVYCPDDPQTVEDSVISDAGEHFFYHASRAGCDSIVRVFADPVNIKASISADRDEINCFFPVSTLSAFESTPAGEIDYLWELPVEVSGVDPTRAVVEADQSGVYTLKITDHILGCTSETSFEITEDFNFPVFGNPNIPVLGCYDISEPIIVTPAEPVPDSYRVSFITTDGRITDQPSEHVAEVDQSGTYYAIIQNLDNGCATIDSIYIARDTNTYLKLEGDDRILSDFCELNIVNLNVNTAAMDSLRWSPAEGLNCSDCLTPSLLADRERELELTVTDTNGCQAKFNVAIELERDFQIYIPNAFSPNDDGINDEFKLFSGPCPVEIAEFTIFDRWGNRLYEQRDFMSTEMESGWTARLRDQPESTGVYVYSVAVRTFRDEIVRLEGEIHLIR